jgi:LPS sulfotransferase NodH
MGPMNQARKQSPAVSGLPVQEEAMAKAMQRDPNSLPASRGSTRVPVQEADRHNVPFFIVGAARSGTTLLRLMLAAHPRLAIPPESHFLVELIKAERQSGGLESVREQVIQWLIAHRRLADFGLEPGFIRGTLEALQPLTTRAIADALFGEYTRRQGKVRWGDKTPRYRAYMKELEALYPGARFIHLLRDGRDAALSLLRAGFGPQTWTQAAYAWRNSVRAAWRGREALSPQAYLEVRYEDLLRHPESVLRSICQFLGEEYLPDMLEFSRSAELQVPSWEERWHSKLKESLDRSNVGKWQRELTAEQLLLFQQVAGRELTAAGYPLAHLRAEAGMHLRNGLRRASFVTSKWMARGRIWMRCRLRREPGWQE